VIPRSAKLNQQLWKKEERLIGAPKLYL